MGPQHVAHVSAYVTDRAHMAANMQARDEFMAGVDRVPSSTLLIVSGFPRAEFKVEVEVLAAAPLRPPAVQNYGSFPGDYHVFGKRHQGCNG